ncbi:hypothetical protein NBH00_12895 [Paraconexibacter antarcticus]|uniref:Uncharacterized protein n=1 Tax=Paraconexibacter antarcticus TaxID=2949664 RepID=A0ABY5DNF5_9ACTN|nr:hypothetical protein [Paraconexibacter antarcticus]UTI62265.1 hypothetical protein NBH00_12895 [Paraconexibacter antarcticus]
MHFDASSFTDPEALIIGYLGRRRRRRRRQGDDGPTAAFAYTGHASFTAKVAPTDYLGARGVGEQDDLGVGPGQAGG